ncbi:MAG: hypothetical protein C0467_25155 [Planctomycetaceae bacterium]|nr:hypothetical protein [Planctomycetaceae bacterium]
MGDERIYFDTALGHFHDGEFDEAVHTCRWGLTVYPDAGRLWEVCGLSLWMRGDLGSALHALEKASVLVPLAPLAQFALAAAYAWADKPDLARTVYRYLAQLPVFPVPLLPRLAAGAGRVGEYAVALLVCEKIVELRPGYHPAWFGIAYYLRKLGRPIGEAIPMLEQALTHAPDEEMYRLNLAACHAQTGDGEAAYRIAETVNVGAVRCRHWLRLLLPVFDAAGDLVQWAACRTRLAELGDDCPRCL